MSWDIYIENANGETIEFDEPIQLCGGTYAVGGTCQAWLNITYNYSKFYYDAFGGGGLRDLCGLSVPECRTRVEAALASLSGEPSRNYWDSTEGNARKALSDLLTLLQASPDTGKVRIS